MEVNSYIKEMRKKKGLTQEELANKLNVDQGRISKWERGELTIDNSYLPILVDILDLNTYTLKDKIMVDIFFQANIKKYLKNIITKENENIIIKNIELITYENDKFNNYLYKMSFKVYTLIKKLVDLTFEHNLSLVETKDELFHSYLNSFIRLKSDNYFPCNNKDYEKKSAYLCYAEEDYFLLLLVPLIILSYKEDNELFEFLEYIVNIHRKYLKETINFKAMYDWKIKNRSLFNDNDLIFFKNNFNNLIFLLKDCDYDNFKVEEAKKMDKGLAYLDMILFFINEIEEDKTNMSFIKELLKLYPMFFKDLNGLQNTINTKISYHLLLGFKEISKRRKYLGTSIEEELLDDKLIEDIFSLEISKKYFKSKNEIKEILDNFKWYYFINIDWEKELNGT